jgi:uncharacterized protein YegL
MSLTTLLDKIADRHHERQQNRKANYRSLVAAIADGREPDPELVDQILADNGKKLNDLRTAVELLTKRGVGADFGCVGFRRFASSGPIGRCRRGCTGRPCG